MLNFIYKYHIGISIVLFSIGLFLTLNFNEANAVKTPITYTDEITNKETTITTYTFERKYEIINVVANTLYGLALSILILIAIDKKFDEKQAAQTQTLKEQKENEYKNELEDLHSKITQNVFDGVLKKFVPEELFSQVQKDIFSKVVVRRNAKWEYHVFRNEYKSFTLKQRIIYDITNTKDGKHQEPINININTTSDLVDTKITYFKVEDKNGNLIEEFKNNFKSPYLLDLEPNETKKVYLNIEQIYKTPSVMDAHTSNFSIIGLQIDVIKPPDVEFDLKSTFTTKLKPHYMSEDRINYDHVPCILLGQGVQYLIKNK